MWNIMHRGVTENQSAIRSPSEHIELFLGKVAGKSLAGISAAVRIAQQNPVHVRAVRSDLLRQLLDAKASATNRGKELRRECPLWGSGRSVTLGPAGRCHLGDTADVSPW